MPTIMDSDSLRSPSSETQSPTSGFDVIKTSGVRGCRVVVRAITGQTMMVTVDLETDDVAVLKRKVARRLRIGAGAESREEDEEMAELMDFEDEDVMAVQLIYRGAELTKGPLRANGLTDGSQVDLTLRMKSGPILRGSLAANDMANQAAASAAAALKASIDQALSALPANPPEKPVQITMQHEGLSITVTVEPRDKAKGGVEEERSRPERQVQPAWESKRQKKLRKEVADREDDEGEEGDVEVALQRRRMQEMMLERARSQAHEEQNRAAEQKKTMSKMEELRAKMQRKRAHVDSALHRTGTVRASGQPAPAPAPPAPPAPPAAAAKKSSGGVGFGGMRRGFLNKGPKGV